MTFSKKHPKSIWQYSDEELFEKYGDNWQVAREMIEEHKANVTNGYLEDWEKISQSWVGQETTFNQEMMLKQNGYRTTYDKRDASTIIDLIIFNSDLKREILYRKQKAERDARQAQKKAEQAEKRRAQKEAKAKREYDLMVKNSANVNRIRTSFEKLWNELLADDKFSEVEIYKLKRWCELHKHLNDDFHGMITLCDKVVEDHVVDSEENGLLYNEALRMIERMIPAE